MKKHRPSLITTVTSNYYRPAHHSQPIVPSFSSINNQSNYIFCLPEAVLTKPELKPNKKAKQQIKEKSYQTIQETLESWKDHKALTTSDLSHTRFNFRSKRNQDVVKEDKTSNVSLVFRNINSISFGLPNKASRSQQQAYGTLEILQKVILTQRTHPWKKSECIELQANKFPIHFKEELKKQKSVPLYDPKYKWEPTLHLKKKERERGARSKFRSDLPSLSAWDSLQAQID